MQEKNKITTSPQRRMLIVADAHLPLDDRPGATELREKFLELLQEEVENTQVYVLLGDIFDFWFEWSHVVPKRALRILYTLHDYIRQGKEVHFFAGNHDFRIDGFLRTEIGMILHQNEWIVKIDGNSVLFHHGDGLAASNHSYRGMKRIMRTPFIQLLFEKVVHPDFAMNLGRWASLGGRIRYKNYPENKPPDTEYHTAAQLFLEQGYDIVIFGHTHRQAMIKLKSGWYHNPGPFMREHRYSVIAGGMPEGKVLP